MADLAAFEELKKCRLRCTRKSDGSLVNGRLHSVSLASIRFNSQQQGVLRAGDEVDLEIHGHLFKLETIARIKLVAGKSVVAELAGGLRYSKPTETARIEVGDFLVRIQYANKTQIVDLLDVSRDGLAIRNSESISPGCSIKIDVRTQAGMIRLKGTARYCRELNDAQKHCRIGIHLSHESRVKSAKWMSFISGQRTAA